MNVTMMSSNHQLNRVVLGVLIGGYTMSCVIALRLTEVTTNLRDDEVIFQRRRNWLDGQYS